MKTLIISILTLASVILFSAFSCEKEVIYLADPADTARHDSIFFEVILDSSHIDTVIIII